MNDKNTEDDLPAVGRLELGSHSSRAASATARQNSGAEETAGSESRNAYSVSASSTTFPPPSIAREDKGEDSSGLGNKDNQYSQIPQNDHPQQLQDISQAEEKPAMSIADIVNTNADPRLFTSSASTNPFRRSPSVSPSQNTTIASAPVVNFRDEDPFSASATSTGAALTSTVSGAPLESTTAPGSPPDLAPPPAYVPVEEPSSVVPLAPTLPERPLPSTQAAVASPLPSPSAAAVSLTSAEAAQVRTNIPPPRDAEPVNEYVLKPIDWIDPATGIEKRIKIITQNENGPCPLLALCNTLILQGKVAIRPYDRPTIGYDHLLELLADYLLNEDHSSTNASSVSSSAAPRTGERVESEKAKSRLEIESALRLLPHLEHGLDVNVYFKSIRGFEPTAELGLFHTFGVELVHGWVVSPVIDSAMFMLVDGPAGITSYNKAVECIVSGDDAGGGLVVEDFRGRVTPISPSNHASQSSSISIQEEQLQNEKITHALVVQEFMNTTRTQLTHYGLHVLQESLPEGHLCAFFRNNHFCTLFKNPMDGILYTLVTDQSLAHEQSIVWESLVDVDGAGDFLDGLFRHGTLEVGDYARNNQPVESQHSVQGDGGGDEDFALALQLQQQEEEEEARRVQRSQSQTSNSRSGNRHNGGRVNDSGGNISGSYQPPISETDEQMAARLHQEFLLSDQQELRQQQQQQQLSFSRPYPANEQFLNYGPQASPQVYTQPTRHPNSVQTQGPRQPPNHLSPLPVVPQGSGQSVGSHSRLRNSSENSSRKDKDKCIIS